MRMCEFSWWDDEITKFWFKYDIENLDKAHKRAKKELRKQQKVIIEKNEHIKCYKEMYDNVVKQYDRLNATLMAFQDSKLEQCKESIEQLNDIINLELKIACLEQENNTFGKEQTNKEKELRERIIQSMNDMIVELRVQLIETEEKYNKLLKQMINRKDEEK